MGTKHDHQQHQRLPSGAKNRLRKILKAFRKVVSAGDDNQSMCLWIFGYGSLMWNPGFAHSDAVRAFLKGYSVRMWQGNTVYRGTTELVID